MAAALILVAVGGACYGGVATATGSDAPDTRRAGPWRPTPGPSLSAGPALPSEARPGDGSLGDPASRAACTLLTIEQIRGAFHADVGPATPVYPTCTWLLDRDAFLTLRVFPGEELDSIPRGRALEDAPGVGRGAFFANNRYLYFSGPGASFALLYQRAGEFTGTRTEALSDLARAVLSRPLPPELRTSDVDVTAAQTGPSVTIGRPTADRPLRVWFAGDSLAAGPSWAFFEDTAEDRRVRTMTEYQVGTGINEAWFWDWYAHAAGALAAWDPHVVVFMAGANDAQPIAVDGTSHAVGSPTWRREYSKRVGRLMDLLAARGRRVVWCGMPPMRDPTLNAGMAEVDRVFAAQVRLHPGVEYVDTWALFSGPGGGYADNGPDVDGDVVPLRLDDGIHLNVAGSFVEAHAVLEAVAEIAGLPSLAR